MASSSPIANIFSKVLLIVATGIFFLAILTLILVVYNEVATVRHENMVKTKLSLQSVVSVIEEYKKYNGQYPSELSQLTGIYLSEVPIDIWNHPYLYEYDAEQGSYRIYTLGSDRQVGGAQDARDFDNYTDWDLIY